MKMKCIDIFNNYCLEIRNNFLIHTQYIRFDDKKICNKQALQFLISSILTPFSLFVFTCIPAAVCVGAIMRPDFDYKVGSTFPVWRFLLILYLLFIMIILFALLYQVLPFLFILFLLLLIIIVLYALLCLYKRKLRGTQEYPIQKKQVPTSKQPYSFNPLNITYKEFIKIIDKVLKRIMFYVLFALFALPIAAQERGSGEYVFRLCDTLSVCLAQLRNEQMYVNVSSYAASPTDALSVWRITNSTGVSIRVCNPDKRRGTKQSPLRYK